MEDALRESEFRWKFAIEGSGDGVWDMNVQTGEAKYSRRWKEMLGYEDSEILPLHREWEDRIHPEDQPRVAQAGQDLLNGLSDSYAVEFRMKCKDDSYKWILSRGMIVSRTADGKASRLIGTHSDITERRQAQAKIIESEERYRTLIEWSPEPIAVIRNTRFAYLNPAAVKLLGASSPQDLLGTPVLQSIHPDGRQIALARMKFILEHGYTPKIEQRYLKLDGTVVDVEVQSVTINYDGAEADYLALHDITERKRNEVALALAKSEADQANRSKSKFLAAASHDLRQPLFALSLFVGVLKKQASPDNAELVHSIQGCVDSLSELLNDLLDVSKLEAGIVTPRPTDFAVDDMLGKLVNFHSMEARNKGLRLGWRRSGLMARCDEPLLSRIVGNFIANAVRFTDKGGALIACRRRAGRQWIEVWDTGIGIPEDKIEFIFEPFSQLDDARTPGSGLGLAIVAKAATLLGLQVRLRSRPGRGSMFAIELPVGRMIEAAQDPAPGPAMRALRIGLVEDDRSVLQALTLALEDSGHELVTATTGRGLLEGLAQRAPDIIISDYRLAGAETGFDVIQLAREIFGTELPALIITGDTDPALMRSMVARGIAVHHKPLQFDKLQSFILNATQTSS